MADAMRAAVLAAPREARVERVPVPEPGPGEVRVRLEGSGVCGSDLALWEGREWLDYPRELGAPGHEGWGRVDAVGEGVEGWRAGDRVTGLFSRAYAEMEVVPAAHLVRIPAALAGKPFPGEPLACGVNAFRRAGISAGTTVAVVGAGFQGALLVGLAAAAGARVVAVSRREYALKVAEAMGAKELVPLRDRQQALDDVRALVGGDLCDVVVEATGKQAPLDLAAELTRVRGRLVIAGYHQDGPRSVDMQLWNWRGLDVVNAHERDPRVYLDGIRQAAEWVAEGRLDPFPLLTHPFPLERLPDAFRMMAERPDGFLKAVIHP